MLENVILIFQSQRTVQCEALCVHSADIFGYTGIKIPLYLNVRTEFRRIISFTPRPH
jgi:hypothetical protein